jgi:hypothetical protein
VFTLPSGTFQIFVDLAWIHPSWNGNPTNSPDIAALHLVTPASSTAERYDIYRDTDELAQTIEIVGYGRSGTGSQGSILSSGTKRDGNNEIDAFGEAFNGTVFPPGTFPTGSHLVFDFDNGNSSNDASGFFLGVNGIGLSSLEVSTAQGDSGGPAFLGNLIAGITSFGLGFNGATDVLPGTNSSFGEFAVDTRVSAYASWVDSIIDVTGAPRITDVLMDGSGWSRTSYSYASIVPTGKQFAPIFTQGVDTIQIAFSEHVLLDGSELTLFGSDPTVIPNDPNVVIPLDYDTFSYDVGAHMATWTFVDPLPADKYRIELSTDVVDVGGSALDAEWDNLTNGTWDNFADDPTGRTFLTGNGTPGSPLNMFNFLFSLLPGDTNQDGVVASADASLGGDVNGDGAANGTDVSIINGLVGDSLVARNKLGEYSNRGDYSDDEIVSEIDFLLWRTTFGSTTDLRADGSGNGQVDAADYGVWRDNLDDYSAWYDGPLPGGGGGSGIIVDFDVAPTVINVTISGSNSVHDPYSFDSVVGSGEQLRTVPVGGADTISITFGEDVNVSASNLELLGLSTANRPTLAEFDYDLFTQTATWRFEGWALGDQYLITLSDAITDVEGDRLDGEWTNPASLFTTNSAVSEFPSGDGNGGGDFNFVLTLLPGDANLDLIVSGIDAYLLYTHMGISDTLFTDGDFDGSGVVTGEDAVFWHENNGINLQNLWVLSDLNGDFLVDGLDLEMLADNVGMSNPTHDDGDLNGDGDIDIDDLDLLFAQYGLELAVVS